MAQALLSGVYANTGRSAEAPAFSRRAFELRDRVSERERFFISWRYYLDAAQAWDKALELAPSWTTTYPREAFAFNSLGLASGAFGQHEQAVDAFREAIRLDARFVPPHGNLAGSLIALNRFAEAKALPARGERRAGSTSSASGGWRICWPFSTNDSRGDGARTGSRARARRRRCGRPSGRRGRRPSRDGFEPRTSCSSAAFRRPFATTSTSSARSGRWRTPKSHAIAGQCAEARREVSARARAQPRQLHARAREPRACAVWRRQRGVEPVGRTGAIDSRTRR